MIVNNEHASMWKEVVMPCLKLCLVILKKGITETPSQIFATLDRIYAVHVRRQSLMCYLLNQVTKGHPTQ
jgi:hypothetical protein